MACLFCGKEIGPIRQLRDREFCSPKHRKEYKDRLQKVLVRVGEPETVPVGMAPFEDPFRIEPGRREKSVAEFAFRSAQNHLRLPNSWPLSIPEVGGRAFARLALTAQDITGAPAARTWQIEPLPYLGERDAARLLSTPAAQLGSVVLRSIDGHVLSTPQARDRGASAVGTSATLPAASLAIPPLALSPAACDELLQPGVPEAEQKEQAATQQPSECAAWMPCAAPEAAARLIEPFSAEAVPVPLALCLPQMLSVLPTEELAQSAEPEPQAPDQNWMPGLAPELAARAIQPVTAEPLCAWITARLPEAIVALPLPAQPALHGASAALALQPAQSQAKPSIPAAAFIGKQHAAPDLNSLAIANPALPWGNQHWIPIPESEPAVCDVRPSADSRPLPFAAAPLRMAPLSLQVVSDAEALSARETPVSHSKPADSVSVPPLSTAPQAPSWNPVEAAPAAARSSQPVTGAPVIQFPKLVARHEVAQPPAGGFDSHTLETVPYGDLLTVEYACQRGPESPLARLESIGRPIPVQGPRFAVRPVFDRLEDLTAQKRSRKRPGFAEIFTMPDAAALTRRKAARHAFTAAAASVTVAMALWFGASAGKLGKSLIARSVADEIAQNSRASGTADGLDSGSRSARPAPNAWTSPVAWVRSEAAKRAAVQLGDSFDNGMKEWGAKDHQMAPGWTRNPDGYVRPGQLALYQPTLHYTDYRLEFFGQIENKSLSWVVRGKDTRNYYAMKFNVVQPGLRPIISMVHYPVIGGKPGKKVEMPLSLMVHNNTPYHVAVDVKGAHFTASIEGQEVDEWTDDSLMAGGVGFFSEAGARARIYWMKVYKNDDWFGRICGLLADGDASAGDTAWLERPQIPAPAPERPAPAPSAAPLWTVETAGMQWQDIQRGRASSKGGIEKWSS